MIIIFIMAIMLHTLVIPYGIALLLTSIGIKAGDHTMRNMRKSRFKFTVERSGTHSIEKFIVLCNIGLTLLFFQNPDFLSLIFIAILMFIEAFFILISRKSIAFCWVLSWYGKKNIRKVDRQNVKIKLHRGVERKKVDVVNSDNEIRVEERKLDGIRKISPKDDLSKRSEVYEEADDRRVMQMEYPDAGEQEQLTIRDLTKAVKGGAASVSRKTKEAYGLLMNKNVKPSDLLNYEAIFSTEKSSIDEVRLDNAMCDGAVIKLYEQTLPALAMDLILLKIIKKKEKELLYQSMIFQNDLLSNLVDNEEISNKIKSAGMKIVKILLWMKDENDGLFCLKLEFSSNILSQPKLRLLLHSTVKEAVSVCPEFSYEKIKEYSISLHFDSFDKITLVEVMKNQKIKDLTGTKKSRYKLPMDFTTDAAVSRNLEDAKYPDTLGVSSIISEDLIRSIQVYNEKSDVATLITYTVSRSKSRRVCTNNTSVCDIDSEDYRVTQLPILIGEQILKPELSESSSIGIIIGDHSGFNTIHLVAYNDQKREDIAKITDENFISRLFTVNEKDMSFSIENIEYIKFIWKLPNETE